MQPHTRVSEPNHHHAVRRNNGERRDWCKYLQRNPSKGKVNVLDLHNQGRQVGTVGEAEVAHVLQLRLHPLGLVHAKDGGLLVERLDENDHPTHVQLAVQAQPQHVRVQLHQQILQRHTFGICRSAHGFAVSSKK